MAQSRPNNALAQLISDNYKNEKGEPTNEALEQAYAGTADFDATIDVKDTSPHYYRYIRSTLTPIHFAVCAGYENVVQWLINKGDNVDRQTFEGRTPLFFAVWRGKSNLITLLINNNANVNLHENEQSRRSIRRSPLLLAVALNQIDSTKLLLSKNADLDYSDKGGYNALKLAEKNPEMLALINTEIKNRQGIFNLLIEASENKIEPTIEELNAAYQLNGRIDFHNNDGFTALHMAAEQNYLKTAEWLLMHGANVNAMTEANFAPLHWAACNGHVELCELLVSKFNADINALGSSSKRTSALHIALGYGRESVAIWLINNNADINIIDAKHTPLHIAIGKGFRSVVQLLLEKKPNLTRSIVECEKLIKLTEITHYHDIIDILNAHLSSLNPPATKPECLADYVNLCDWKNVNKIIQKKYQHPESKDEYVQLNAFYQIIIDDLKAKNNIVELKTLYHANIFLPLKIEAQLLQIQDEALIKPLTFQQIINESLRIINKSTDPFASNLAREILSDRISFHVDNIHSGARAIEVAAYFESPQSNELKKYFTRTSYGLFNDTSDWDTLKSAIISTTKNKIAEFSGVDPVISCGTVNALNSTL